MARKKAKDPPPPVPVSVGWRIHIGKDRKGELLVNGWSGDGSINWLNGDRVVEEVAIIEPGRSFTLSGDLIVFEGMRGSNADPWSARSILAAARFGMFGFRLRCGG